MNTGVLSDAERRELVVRHGSDPIAYSTLQQGLRYFDTSFGYVAYHPAWGTQLTLGPPVCAASDLAEVTSRFLRRHPRASFFYLPRAAAECVEQLGGSAYRSAVVGVDRVVALGDNALVGDPRVRGAVRKGNAAQLELAHVQRPSAEERVRLLALNREYLATHPPGSELRFLNRPLQLEHDADGLSRLYLLRWTEQGRRDVRAFARLNPYFEAGQARGYLLDIFRLGRTRLWGVFLSTVVQLAQQLREARVSELSLGFCPLHLMPTRGSLLERQVGWLARHLQAVPYVERLRANKAVFPGEDRPRYLVTRGNALQSFLALLSASGAPLRSLAGSSVLASVSRPYLAGRARP